MSFWDTLTKNLGFNNEPNPTVPKLQPLQPGQSMIQRAVGTQPSPLLQTIQKNIGMNTVPVPKLSVGPKIDTKALTKKAGEFAVDFARAFPRAVATIGQTIGHVITPENMPEEVTPSDAFSKFLFGDKSIKTIGKQSEDIKPLITELSNKYLNTSKTTSGSIAKYGSLPIVVAGSLLDLTGVGGSGENGLKTFLKGEVDNFVEQGIKETTDDGAYALLRKAGIDSELAREQAPLIAKATNKKEVKAVLEDTIAKHTQKVERMATRRIAELEAKKNGIEETGVPPEYLSAKELDELQFLKENIKSPEKLTLAYHDNTPIPERNITNPLTQEARKYKTAEEFVKAQHETTYRGASKAEWENVQQTGKFEKQSGTRFIDKRTGKEVRTAGDEAINTSPDKRVADLYGAGSSKEGVVIEFKPEAKGKMKFSAKFDATDLKADEYLGEGLTLNDVAKVTDKNGKVIYEATTSGKTKSQLTDIWNKAQSKNITQVAETKALNEAVGTTKERKYITSTKASEHINESIKGQLAGTYDVKTNSALVDRAMGRVSSNVEEAKKFALSEATDESIATGTSLVHHYGNEIVNATTKEAKLASASEAANIINKQAEMLTEAGRTVQAASLIGRQTPEGLLVTTARKIKEYNKAHPTKKIPELTGENVVDILEKGKKIEKMPDGLTKDTATKKLADTLESLIPSSMWNKFTNIWKAGLLTGIKTSGVNITSNFFNGFAENVKNIPATGIDFATALFTGKRTKALNLRGLGQGSAEGVKKGWDYLRTGVSKESGESALEFAKIHYDSTPGKLLGAYAEGIYRVLGTEDMPFFYGALRRSLGEQALVTIKNEGKVFSTSAEKSKWIQDFIDNPAKNALDIADLDAKIATFKNDTELGKIANSIRTASPLTEVILPFAKTPSAVATAMFDYSPAGAVHTLYRNFIKGPFNQKDFAEGLGRSVTGTGALWLGSQLYKDNKISLEYPVNEKERAKWEATGKIPNAILIEDKWIPLVLFGPIGSVLGIGGYITKGQEETGSLSGGVISGLTGGAKGLTEQTFLTGVKNLMDAINEPSKKGTAFAGGLLASIVPTIVSDFNQAFDDYQRKSSGTILGPLEARIPGVRETLPKKLDVWGQPLERNRTEIGTAISPIRLSNTIQGKLNTEVERLGMVGEDIRPTKVDSTISSIKLDDTEYYKYQKLYGGVATKALSALIDNKEYQQLDPENQAKEWKKVVSEIRGTVSDAILPMLLKKRYNLPDNVDMKAVTELTTGLYKKFPAFSKAPYEKQRKAIIKLLKIEGAQPLPESNIVSFLKDTFGTKVASAAEMPVSNKITFVHGNKNADINEIKRQVAFRESGISKDPYKTIGKATGDLGKYQVNPTTLAENSQRFLGKKITPEEFLNSPADQEKFFEKTMEKFKTSFGVKNMDTALILWHRGFGNISSNRITKLRQDPEVKKYLANRPS